LFQAGRLKKALANVPGVVAQTSWGSGGQMDIFRDGVEIFSYQKTKKMPSVQELLEIVLKK
jgi:hypothetical protein